MIRRFVALALLMGGVLFGSVARLAHAEEDAYVVLVGVAPDDAYHAAAARLAEAHGAPAPIPFDVDRPEDVLPLLRKIRPRNVAVVLRPEQIDVNSVRRFLRMATSVDDDPFADFSFGFITGATPEEALAFVERTRRAAESPRPAAVAKASVWGGSGKSRAGGGTYTLGNLAFPLRTLHFVAPDGKHGRDQAFLDAHLPDLEGVAAILMGGHGMPWEIGSGPRVEDLEALDLFPAVAFNYACYTGVTLRWPERKFAGRAYVHRIREIEKEQSFALAMIRAGVTAYVATVNPRPAGPEMTTDFERVLAGQSLGEVRRNDQAKIALGYLGFGERGIVPPPFVDGERIPRAQVDPVRHMMLDGATGGILYGDPAFRPFPPHPDALPLKTETKREGDELHVTMTMAADQVYLWGADPFRRFGERDMAMKLYDRVLLPADLPTIRSVRVEGATWGRRKIDTLDPVWALETDHGRTFLHVKPGFARGGTGDVRIHLVASPKAAPPKAASPKAEEVPTTPKAAPQDADPVLAAVRKANAAALRPGRASEAAIREVAPLGERGFQAVCRLIREGEGHWRTYELLRALAYPGSETLLRAMADGEALPGYGRWTALQGLGVYEESDEVRTYLLGRLAREKDAGLFMSAAQALGMLGEEKAVDLVGKQLLSFADGWSGVERHLIAALGKMGPKAAKPLNAFLADPRAKNEASRGAARAALAAFVALEK